MAVDTVHCTLYTVSEEEEQRLDDQNQIFIRAFGGEHRLDNKPMMHGENV